MSVYNDLHRIKSTRNLPQSDDRYLQLRKLFQGLMKNVALEARKSTQHRNQSMKLKAKKGRKDYRG